MKLETGQVATIHQHEGFLNLTVLCFKCKKPIGMNHGNLDHATGLAWFDNSIRKYVHRNCLSLTAVNEPDEMDKLEPIGHA